MIKKTWAAAVSALVLGAVAPVFAQQFPDKPVRIIVPYATGGTTDFTARVVAERLSRKWGVGVFVENKPGASGNIGTEALTRARPDGYTLGFVASQHAAAPALFPKLSFSLTDFKALTIATQSRMGLLTRQDLPANSVQELIVLAKKEPGGLTAATGGPTSVNNRWLKAFEKTTGTSFLAVPFNGSGPGHIELLAGRIDVTFDVPSVVLPHIQSGKMKLLAVGGVGRAAAYPNTPTLDELGFPGGQTMLTWSAFLVPVQSSPEVAAKLSRDLRDVLNEPDVRERLEKIGLEVVASPSKEADEFIASEAQRMSQFVRENNIKVE